MSESAVMRVPDWGLLGFLSLLWGGSFFFSKIALSSLPPLTIVAIRVGLAAIALWGYLRLRHIPIPRGAAIWSAFSGMGLLNSLIPFTLIFWGQTVIGSGLASVLNATTPVFAILVAHVATNDERLSVSTLVGIVLSVAGVAVLLHGNVVAGSKDRFWGVIACLGAALSYGCASSFGRRFGRMGISPALGAFGQIAATSCMAIPLALSIDRPWQIAMPGIGIWIALCALALLSTALAYIVFFRLIATIGATNTSLVTLLIPVSAILLGILLLGETVTRPQAGGMALIAAGLVAIDGRIFRSKRIALA